MATVSALSPAEISARRLAAVAAELKRNGIDPSKRSEPMAPLPPEKRQFTSRPDAKPMVRDDINNVRMLTSDEESAFMRRLRLTSPRLHASLLEATDELWDAWPESDVRWTLTPHKARKLNPLRSVKTK